MNSITEKISLYDLILYWFYFAQNDDYNKLLKEVNIDTSDESYITELKNKCNTIGANGWVYSPFIETEPHRTVTYIDDWIDAINSGEEERIEKYFTENNFLLIKKLYGRIITELINIDEYRFSFGIKEALDNFFDKRYISCAHILFSTLEGLIRSNKINIWRRQITRFYNDTTKAEFEQTDIYSKTDKIAFFIEKHLMLPSFDAAFQRFYNLDPAHQFGNPGCVEPNYIQRDWLLHGMTNRIVTQNECIQLFNAIVVFLGMRTDLANS